MVITATVEMQLISPKQQLVAQGQRKGSARRVIGHYIRGHARANLVRDQGSSP